MKVPTISSGAKVHELLVLIDGSLARWNFRASPPAGSGGTGGVELCL